MAKKKASLVLPRNAITFPETFHRSSRKIPDGYYSGDKPNPESAAVRRGERHALRPGNRRLQRPGLQQADRDDQGDGHLQHARLLVEEAAPGDPAVHPPLHQAGDIVLDPFCGSGGTAVSALLDGRKAIAIDRSPAATFIAKNHCTPVDPDKLRRAFQKVKRAVQNEIDWLYETRCDRCGGKAMTGYTVYSARYSSALAAYRKFRSTIAAKKSPRPPPAKPRASTSARPARLRASPK